MQIETPEVYDLPTWAACAVINNDFSGLNSEESKMVKLFLAYMEGALMSIREGDPYFCWHPIFGLACECVEMEAVYLD